MVAAQKFNQKQDNINTIIYGSVTTGSLWRFLKLDRQNVIIDLTEYPVYPVDRILGMFVGIISNITMLNDS